MRGRSRRLVGGLLLVSVVMVLAGTVSSHADTVECTPAALSKTVGMACVLYFRHEYSYGGVATHAYVGFLTGPTLGSRNGYVDLACDHETGKQDQYYVSIYVQGVVYRTVTLFSRKPPTGVHCPGP